MTDRVSQITALAQSLSDDLEQQKALVAQLWTPRSLNPVAWYDPSNAASLHLDANGALDRVDDLSGNGRHKYAGTTKPAMSSLLGSPSISGGWMKATGFPVGSAFSVFCLASIKRTAFGQLVAFKADSDAGDWVATSCEPLCMDSTMNLQGNKGGNKSSVYGQPVVGGTHGGIAQLNQPLMDDMVMRLGSVFDNGTHTLYMDGVASDAVTYSSGANSPGTLTFLARGDGTYPWGGALGETIILDRVPTADERERIDAWLARHWDRILVVEGDSLPHAGPTFGGYAYAALPNLTKSTYLLNLAVGGSNLNSYDASGPAPQRFGSVAYRAPFWRDVRIPKNKGGKEYVLYFAVTNNLGGSGTMDAYVEATGQYAIAAKAAGFDKVVTSTVLSRTDVGQANDTKRHAYNSAITAPGWAAAHGIDAIADFAAHPIMGVDAAPTLHPEMFNDGVHPSPLGNGELAPILWTTLNSI